MTRFLLAGASLLALTIQATAADMPPAPVADEAIVESGVWEGFYVGAQGGYSWAEIDLTLFDDAADEVLSDDFDAEGFNGGLYGGWNAQSGNWVFGLDASASYVDIDEEIISFTTDLDGGDDEDVVVDAKIDFLGLARGRVGYAFDNFLVFAAGGLAVAHQELSLTVDGDIVFDESVDDFSFGWTVGGGVEAKLSDSWSARVEYLYVDIGEAEYDLPADVSVESGANMHVVRGGVAYHF